MGLIYRSSVVIEMVAFDVSPEFGYVALVAAGSWGLNLWQMLKVGRARKQLNVPYPAMYSEDKPLFNCVMNDIAEFGMDAGRGLPQLDPSQPWWISLSNNFLS